MHAGRTKLQNPPFAAVLGRVVAVELVALLLLFGLIAALTKIAGQPLSKAPWYYFWAALVAPLAWWALGSLLWRAWARRRGFEYRPRRPGKVREALQEAERSRREPR
jgi:hypothetical protein